ncbi:MAG: prepilin-type N-terminal cleavage/methylation domain-containing protein [Oscillospiraceae bacterium]
MKENNKGFTLVELIVSVAILGIVALAAGGFMIAGSRAYSNLSYTLRLQYESQLIMEQVQEYLVDCSAGMAWDGNTLYVVDNDDSVPSSTKKVYVFTWDSTDQTIRFNSGAAAENISGITAIDLMAEHVSLMQVEFADSQREVTVKLKMERNGKSYEAQQVIALRNQPPHEDTWDALWNTMNHG